MPSAERKQTSKSAYTVSYVGYGIANRFPGHRIEMHSKLLNPEYAPLHKEILEHEKNHTEGWRWKDVKLDIKGFKNKALYRKFFFTTPSAWVQLSPCYKSQGLWYWDSTLLAFYSVLIWSGVALWILL